METTRSEFVTDDVGQAIELVRYGRWLRNTRNEWTIWLMGVLMVLMNGMMWMVFPPAITMSLTARVLSGILLGLLLLPLLRVGGGWRSILKRKIQLRMNKDLRSGICPVCGVGLARDEEGQDDCCCCANCGSAWAMGKIDNVSQRARIVDVWWLILERLATVLAVIYFVLISFRLVALVFTVGSVMMVFGGVLGLTIVLRYWERRCFGLQGS